MRKFKAVIFDMDGLLLDSEKLALDAFQTTCLSFELGDLTELFKRCIGTNSERGQSILKDGLKGIADYEKFSLVWNTKYKRITDESPIPLKSGVKQLLDYIESIGIPIAVATSTKTDSAKSKLKSSGIIEYFDVIIGGDQVAQSKPEPEIYLKAASTLAKDPSNCLAVEDSANGVKSALEAGMTVVQIPDLVQPDEALLKMGHIVLASLDDVLEYDFGR